MPRPACPSSPARRANAVAERSAAPTASSASRSCSRRPRAAAARGCASSTRQEELEAASRPRASEAKTAFGDETVYLEKAIVPPRHVEIQVLGDRDGNVVHASSATARSSAATRRSSRRRRRPALDDDIARGDGRGAVRAAGRSATTTRAPSSSSSAPDGSFYFLEMNTRLQVEHPVTELVTGVDLVREQLRVAAGEPLALTGRAPRRGARDRVPPLRGGSGPRLRTCARSHHALPAAAGPGVRVDTYLEEGGEISPYYDSLIAKVIVWAETGRRRSPAQCARSTRSASTACRRRASSRSTSSARRSSGAATTRRASWRRWRGACRRSQRRES